MLCPMSALWWMHTLFMSEHISHWGRVGGIAALAGLLFLLFIVKHVGPIYERYTVNTYGLCAEYDNTNERIKAF
jgi:hypothetical protein